MTTFEVGVSFRGSQAFTSVETEIRNAMEEAGFSSVGSGMGLWSGAKRDNNFQIESDEQENELKVRVGMLIAQKVPEAKDVEIVIFTLARG